MGKRVLLVEDEELIVEMLLEYFDLMGQELEVEVAHNLAEARELLRQKSFDVCICDCRLPDGLACVLFEEDLVKSPVIITTGYVDQEQIATLREKASVPVQILSKPYQPQDLLNLVQCFLDQD